MIKIKTFTTSIKPHSLSHTQHILQIGKIHKTPYSVILGGVYQLSEYRLNELMLGRISVGAWIVSSLAPQEKVYWAPKVEKISLWLLPT